MPILPNPSVVQRSIVYRDRVKFRLRLTVRDCPAAGTVYATPVSTEPCCPVIQIQIDWFTDELRLSHLCNRCTLKQGSNN